MTKLNRLKIRLETAQKRLVDNVKSGKWSDEVSAYHRCLERIYKLKTEIELLESTK